MELDRKGAEDWTITGADELRTLGPGADDREDRAAEDLGADDRAGQAADDTGADDLGTDDAEGDDTGAAEDLAWELGRAALLPKDSAPDCSAPIEASTLPWLMPIWLEPPLAL